MTIPGRTLQWGLQKAENLLEVVTLLSSATAKAGEHGTQTLEWQNSSAELWSQAAAGNSLR